jgi:hypothetical protein
MTDLREHLPSRWVGACIAAVLVVALFGWAVVGRHLGSGSGTSPAATSGPASVLQIRGVRSIATPGSPAYGQTNVTCGHNDPCTTAELLHAPNIVLGDHTGVRYRLGPVVVTGDDIVSARALTPTAEIPTWQVNFKLTPSARERFAAVTERLAEVLPPRQIAIVVDGSVVSAPTVQAPITSGLVQLGSLTAAEARSLVAQLS